MCRPTKPATSSTASSITLKARTSTPCVRNASLLRVRALLCGCMPGRAQPSCALGACVPAWLGLRRVRALAARAIAPGLTLLGWRVCGRVACIPTHIDCGRAVFVYSCPGFSLKVRERMLYASCKGPLLNCIEGELEIKVDRKLEIENGTEFTHEEFYNTLHPVKQVPFVAGRFLRVPGEGGGRCRHCIYCSVRAEWPVKLRAVSRDGRVGLRVCGHVFDASLCWF